MDIAADKRLQRVYGITLAEYEERLAAQNGVCKICLRPPGLNRLAVDHDHRFDRVKITVVRKADGYEASAFNRELNINLVISGKDRKECRKILKQRIRRKSIRALLCWHCNSGLMKYSDIPERFRRAAEMLTEFNNSIHR